MINYKEIYENINKDIEHRSKCIESLNQVRGMISEMNRMYEDIEVIK